MRLAAGFVLAAGVLLAVCGCSGSEGTGGPSMDVTDAADAGEEEVAGDAEDAAIPRTCEEGEKMCISGKQAVCHATLGWLIEACPEKTTCENGECVASACEPLTARCTDGGVQICAPDGKGWSKPMPCPEGTDCLDGVCVEPTCDPGTAVCTDNKVLECAADGKTWTSTPCEEGQVCFEGQCIECVADEDCDAGLSCEAGLCVAAPLEIVTAALPDGKVGEEYEATLEAKGGTAPYTWALKEGTLPEGLTLSAAGTVSGKPKAAGDCAVTVVVTDKEEATAEKEYAFTIFAAATEIVITTGSPLPAGEEGTPYSQQLAATGGVEPYTWGIVGGALPDGLTLSSTGLISGVPAAHGEFTFVVKVFDNGEPTGTGSKEFKLTLKIAPLEIIGDQEFDLFVAKVIVLPLITVVEGIPIPYSTQLQAKGGVKPYQWSEVEMPGFMSFLIPNAGIPEGLTLADNGTLSGSVTDPNAAVNVKIPFTQINLTGFFFMAQVEDSQSPPDSATALFLMPTVPVSF